MLRRTSAERIRSVWICVGVSFALFCASSLQEVRAQDGAGTTAEKTANTDAQPATSKSKTTSHPSATAKSHYRKSRRSTSKRRTARGQQKIDPERAQEIQQALIREHYLSPKDEGTWNQASEDAMRRYQADHGWQSKTVPDSRALISLGLGPSHDHLLNPESAMTSDPAPAHENHSTAASVHASAFGSSSSSPTPPAHSQADPATTSNPTAAGPQNPQ